MVVNGDTPKFSPQKKTVIPCRLVPPKLGEGGSFNEGGLLTINVHQCTFNSMTNKTISTTEARKNISKIMDEVEAGKASYTILRNNSVVARLVSKEFGEKNRVSPNLAKEFKQVLADYGPALKELAKR